MGIFFKSKRHNKIDAHSNISFSNESVGDIKVGIDIIFKFMKEMRDDLKDTMREIGEEVKRTTKRINYLENELNELKVRLAVLENTITKKGK